MCSPGKHHDRHDELEFKFLLALTLPAFFVATLLKRAMPWNWGADKRSVLSATRSAAYNSIPFAFM